MIPNKSSDMSHAPTYEKSLLHLLEFCAKNGDDANSKLAQKTLENSKTVGLDKAMEELAKNCFIDQKTGKSLNYFEMRTRYG